MTERTQALDLLLGAPRAHLFAVAVPRGCDSAKGLDVRTGPNHLAIADHAEFDVPVFCDDELGLGSAPVGAARDDVSFRFGEQPDLHGIAPRTKALYFG